VCLFDKEKAGSFKGGGVGVFHSVFLLFYKLVFVHVRLLSWGCRGRKGNGRRKKKTMERGKEVE